MIEPQEIFDTVVAHLRKQGSKSLDETGKHCRYHGVDGKRCPVGYFIPDDEYNPAIEGSHIEDLIFGSDLLRGTAVIRILVHNIWLIEMLEEIHDNYPVDRWEERFEVLARWNDLKYTPPEPIVSSEPAPKESSNDTT